MLLDGTKKPIMRMLVFGLLSMVALIGVACGSTPTPTSVATQTPVATPTAQLQDPGPAPQLSILSPRDGAGIESGAVRVIGETDQDAVVAVNGVPVEVDAEGRFFQDLMLEPGANTLEIVATDFFGQTVFEAVVVFSVTPTASLPFSLFYPADGLTLSQPTVELAGGTVPYAVVGINGVPVEVGALGIFSQTVSLDEGANLIEVVAADFEDNLRFETVVVFYIP
jgi:uncharacterized protein YfaP (DUF2135 family)